MNYDLCTLADSRMTKPEIDSIPRSRILTRMVIVTPKLFRLECYLNNWGYEAALYPSFSLFNPVSRSFK